MKKITSIPSTKAQQFLYTDFSIIDTPTHPRHILNNILSFLKKIFQFRIYLSKFDFQELFQPNENFLKQHLDINSMEQCWQLFNLNKDDRLQQRQIMSFLTKIIIGMTKHKNQCAKKKQFDKFAQYKTLIEWFEGKVVQVEQQIRTKIKEKAINKMMKQRGERQVAFKKEEKKIREDLEEHTKQIEEQFQNRTHNQKKLLEKVINDQAQKQLYIYKPSKKLHETKETSLLTKLAPYKNEKKRPYECKLLEKSLDLAITQQKNRVQSDIKHYKQTQRNRLKRKQQLQHECYITKLRAHNDEIITKLENKKDQLNKAENIKIKKLIHDNDRISRERIQSLKNSLKAYSQRDQQTKIRQIMQNHRQTIQYINQVENIVNITGHDQFSPRYSTLNMDAFRQKRKRRNRYSQLKTEKKILRKIKNQEMEDDDVVGLSSARKSLVDMYNQDLQQV